jgi:putative DNA primase/helicase
MQQMIDRKLAVVADANTDSQTVPASVSATLRGIIGQDPQSIDRKYLEHWRGILRVRIMLLMNAMPNFKDETGVTATRFIVLQLKQSWLDKEDPFLFDKLCGELSGILNRAIEGLQRLVRRGRFAEVNRELNEELANAGSSIRSFVAERCVLGDGLTTIREVLGTVYREWCGTNGIPHKDRIPLNQFSMRLKEAFPGIGESRPYGGARARVYTGIALRPGAESALLKVVI